MDKKISRPSAQSLFLEMKINGHNLSTGTGFIVNSQRGPVLITNRHNVTGKNNITGETLSSTGHTPDEITITHNHKGGLGRWIKKNEPLINDKYEHLWFEHPTLGPKADFVALLLTQLEDVGIHPYSVTTDEWEILVSPSDIISVVGFPFGLTGGGSFAIWATGFLATELDLDYDDLPIFLIDCRSRPGQSGSAVIAQRNAGFIRMNNGDNASFSSPLNRFLGVYSGRINSQSDLGIVWKSSAIQELVNSI